MFVTITRRSKVGFGYNTSVEEVWNKNMTQSWLQVRETTKPDITGTILTVCKEIQADNNFQSLRQGTYHTIAWFVKDNEVWRKIKNTDENNYKLDELTMKNDFDRRERTGNKFWSNSVTVEVE